MDELDSDKRRKAAIVAAALLVICGLLSIVLSAVSVGVVDNLPVFSRSTINYGVQGSQLFQTGEVKSRVKESFLVRANVSDCEVKAQFALRKSAKNLFVCTKNRNVFVVLREISSVTGVEERLYFTVGEWKRFMAEVFDVMFYLVTNVKCNC